MQQPWNRNGIKIMYQIYQVLWKAVHEMLLEKSLISVYRTGCN